MQKGEHFIHFKNPEALDANIPAGHEYEHVLFYCKINSNLQLRQEVAFAQSRQGDVQG